MRVPIVVSIGVFVIFLALPTFVSADEYEHPLMAFCEHQGYQATLQDTGNIFEIDGICQFPDNSTCKLSEFYQKTCGELYLTEPPCRNVGEVVFTSFESCCEGLEVNIPDYVLGQPSCVLVQELNSLTLPWYSKLWLLAFNPLK